MLAASLWLWRFVADDETTKARNRFDEYCEAISNAIAGRLHNYKMILQGGAGLFIASEEVNREEWRAYYEYRQVQTLYPGIQGLGFAKVIPAADLARHVESVRAEGFPEYAVRPEGERDIYTPVVFLEPFHAVHQTVLGYDMYSEPVRRAAMERARDAAAPAMTGRLRLVIEDAYEEVQSGYILYVPVFARGRPQLSVEDRRAALIGYVYAIFRVKDLMRGIFPVAPRKVAFELYDGPTVAPEALLFGSRELEGGSGNGHRPRFSAQNSLEPYGHTWTLAFHSTPPLEAEEASRQPWIILAGGLAASILLFLLMRSQQRVTEKAEALAAALTVDLRKSEQRLTHLNTVSPAVVYTLAPADFSATWVSPNVTALTGYAPEEALQPSWWANHLHPEDRERALERSSAVLDTGRVVHEYRFQRKDGEFIWILDELRLLRDDSGQAVEIVGSWLDVTDRKRAEVLASAEHQRIVSVLNNLPGFVCLIGPDYSLPFVNAEFRKRFGDPEGRRCFELLFGRDKKCDTCRTFEVFETKAPLEWDWTGPDQRIYRIYDYPYTDRDGSLLVLELGLDITEQKLIETELVESESRFSNIFKTFLETLPLVWRKSLPTVPSSK